MWCLSAGGGPCANLQQERTWHSGWLSQGCSRVRWVHRLHSLRVMLIYPVAPWLGLWGLVHCSAGEDLNLSLTAITVPLHRMMQWVWVAISVSHERCSSVKLWWYVYRIGRSRGVDSPVACLVQKCCRQDCKHFIRSQHLFIGEYTQQATKATRLSMSILVLREHLQAGQPSVRWGSVSLFVVNDWTLTLLSCFHFISWSFIP